MVASFPEFEYKKHKPQPHCKGGCIPSAHHKPSKSKPTLHPRANYFSESAAADSTLLGKILSFNGSFKRSHSTSEGSGKDPNEEMRDRAHNPILGDYASKFLGKKNRDSHVGDEPILPNAHSSDGDFNAGKSHDYAIKIRTKWSNFKAASLHASKTQASKMGGNPVCQAEDEFLNAHLTVENVDSTRGTTCSHLVSLSAQEDESGVEGSNPAMKVRSRGSLHNATSDDAREGDLVLQKCTQNWGEGRNVANANSVLGNDVARSSNGNCANARKVSYPVTVLPNFGNENFSYTSDNSSNNIRWSSTSCVSTDTSSSNSTRRSSCESRIPLVPSTAPFSSHAKPHKAHDATWAAIQNLHLHNGGVPLSIAHFKLVRRVGHGDIGSVFLAHLKEKVVASPSDVYCLFAIKVMDKDALAHRNKLQRMHMEKEILEAVDHPFLPTLYAHFNSEHFSCLVMDFCPGGDLYALRQKQSGKKFDIVAARFYMAEVLLALEYLHMLGIVYRDLKPENVLVREDGHIMLTDFDLSLKCDVKPKLLKHSLLPSSALLMSSSSSSSSPSKRRLMRSQSQSSAISSSRKMSSFPHHDPINCRLPAACSIDPIVSCLSLADKSSSRKDQKQHKYMASMSMSDTKSSKASCSSRFRTPSCRDGINVEPLQLAKQEIPHADFLISKEKLIRDNEASRRNATITTRHVQSHQDEANVAVKPTDTALKSGLGCQEDNMVFMELVAEPTQARSMSFVGTHEYLAPEIIAGHGHGSPVDWWTLGIFLYELLFGRTPFKGASNDQTLINIIRQQLRFPQDTTDDNEDFENARSLIHGLLAKDPRKRLGFVKGAAEIKQHAFFKGVNWALIRSMQPPEMPRSSSRRQTNLSSAYREIIHNNQRRTASNSLHDFDFF